MKSVINYYCIVHFSLYQIKIISFSFFVFRTMSENQAIHLKAVVVGFGSVGKSSMIITHHTQIFPEDYIPYNASDMVPDCISCNLDGQTFDLEIVDTAGAEDYDRVRPVVYPGTDVFILLFDVSGSSEAFAKLESYWFAELQYYCPDVPIILVASKIDLRDMNECTIDSHQGRKMATAIHAACYFEISSRNRKGLTELFVEVVRIGYHYQLTSAGKSSKNCTLL